jgi:hypothetical protein
VVNYVIAARPSLLNFMIADKQALRERFLPFYEGTVNFTDGQGRPQAVTASSYDELYQGIRRDGRLRGWS